MGKAIETQWKPLRQFDSSRIERREMPDKVRIGISAKTMEGLPAIDPEVRITITEATLPYQEVATVTLKNFSGHETVEIPAPEDTFPTWQVNTSFSRYDGGSGFFFMPRGNANPSHEFLVSRLPNKWAPAFTQLAELLSPRFDRFKQVVAVSTDVDLKSGPAIGDLSAKYDAVAGTPQVLAKTALLNLYAVLSDEVDPIANAPWFSYVRRFVRLDQERFLAEVDPALFENVQTIVNELSSTYKAKGFFTEPPADLPLHIPNIPTKYHSDANLVQILTLKKDYEQGNVQLTVSFLRVNGVAVHLLDCDMDEHRNIVLHSFDIVNHMINGGTNPISMHEYIVRDSAQTDSNGNSSIDLGYKLV
jgi:hypothetical protein